MNENYSEQRSVDFRRMFRGEISPVEFKTMYDEDFQQSAEQQFWNRVARSLADERWAEYEKIRETEALARVMEEASPFDSRMVVGEGLTELGELETLVDGILHREGVGVIYGEPEAGKTPVVVDLALSIASGRETWLGRRINRHGGVAYVAAEGGPSFAKWVRGWMQTHGDAAMQQRTFAVLDSEPVDLTNPDEIAQLEIDIAGALGESPALIVFDTLIDMSGGADENDAASMHRVMSAAKAMSIRHGCLVLLLHHTGKSKSGAGKNERGSSAIRGKADVMVELVADDWGMGHAVWDKAKGLDRRGVGGAYKVADPGPYVEWLTSVSELAQTPAAAKAQADLGREANTRAFVLDLVMEDPGIGVNEVVRQITKAVEAGADLWTSKGKVSETLRAVNAERDHVGTLDPASGDARSPQALGPWGHGEVGVGGEPANPYPSVRSQVGGHAFP